MSWNEAKKADVVMLCGFPASGKSTEAKPYIDRGYVYLNRDTEGGKVSKLLPMMVAELGKGNKVVLDNTFMTKESREPFIEACAKKGVKIKCIHMTTSIEDSQYNACTRMIKKHGKLLSNKECADTKSPNTFPIIVLFAARKKFEEPTLDEGFSCLEKPVFVRKYDKTYTKKALILDYDGTLRVTRSGEKYPRSPKDVKALLGRAEKLAEFKANGYILLGVSNQSGISKGVLTDADARACFDVTNKLVGHDIDYRFCPHRPTMPFCYCRKPQVGLGVSLIEEYKLDPSSCIFVGDMTSDKTFARRCGFQYVDQKDFFK